jgi:hypothetical protein
VPVLDLKGVETKHVKREPAGWNWGCVSAIDVQGRTIWIADAHGYGKRYVVHADELLTAFLELQSAILQPRKRESRLN